MQCKKCSHEKPASEFYAKSGKICKACCIARAQAYYFAHHEARKAWHRRYNKQQNWGKGRKQERRGWLKDLKSGPCVDCGRSFPPECMDFDHRKRAQKTFNVSTGLHRSRPKEVILDEIAKCDLVCANCHRIRTAKQMGWL